MLMAWVVLSQKIELMETGNTNCIPIPNRKAIKYSEGTGSRIIGLVFIFSSTLLIDVTKRLC